MELVFKIEETVKANFQINEGKTETLKDKLQNSLIASYELLEESDYLWAENTKECWEKTLNDTHNR